MTTFIAVHKRFLVGAVAVLVVIGLIIGTVVAITEVNHSNDVAKQAQRAALRVQHRAELEKRMAEAKVAKEKKEAAERASAKKAKEAKKREEKVRTEANRAEIEANRASSEREAAQRERRESSIAYYYSNGWRYGVQNGIIVCDNEPGTPQPYC